MRIKHFDYLFVLSDNPHCFVTAPLECRNSGGVIAVTKQCGLSLRTEPKSPIDRNSPPGGER